MSDPENCNQEELGNRSSAPESKEIQGRRQFLQSLGKWSGAAIVAAVGGAWLITTPKARAGGWINRRGYGGGWINGGGGWINRAGWINRGGGWINGVGGGGGWINRRGYGGSWINRR